MTQVANDCWKFLFCWNDTGVPILVARTTLVPGVTVPVKEPTVIFWGVPVVGVEGAEVVPTAPGFCCSRRFCNYSQRVC